MSTLRRKQSLGAISHDCLRSAAFFKDRDPAFLAKMTEYLQIEIFTAGKDILTMGATGDKMYFLHFGEVEVLVGPDLISVAKLGSGTVFGEMAMFGAQKRTATVRATEFCDCRAIRHSHFQAILKLFPKERRYFEKLAAERLKELQKVQQKDLERRPRLNARWLSGFFQNQENSKDESSSSPTSPTRRHSIGGVRSACKSNTNPQPQRRHSVGAYERKPEQMPERMPTAPAKQSNQHDSQGSTRVSTMDLNLNYFSDDEETKVDSEETSSSGCVSGQTSGANSPRAPLPIATRIPGLFDALLRKDNYHTEAIVGSQEMCQEESGEQYSEVPDSLAILASNGQDAAGDTESGSCSPARNRLRARRPSRPPASSPSAGYVRRLSNIRRARTLDDSTKGISNETVDLQGIVLPVITPIQQAKSRPKTSNQGALNADVEMENMIPAANIQSPSNRSFSLHGRSVLTRRNTNGLLDKMKLDNATLSKGVQQLSRSMVQ